MCCFNAYQLKKNSNHNLNIEHGYYYFNSFLQNYFIKTQNNLEYFEL